MILLPPEEEAGGETFLQACGTQTEHKTAASPTSEHACGLIAASKRVTEGDLSPHSCSFWRASFMSRSFQWDQQGGLLEVHMPEPSPRDGEQVSSADSPWTPPSCELSTTFSTASMIVPQTYVSRVQCQPLWKCKTSACIVLHCHFITGGLEYLTFKGAHLSANGLLRR